MNGKKRSKAALNCDPFTFNTECTELNRRFKKNQGKKDVKAHHYILSFAPEDVTEHGLTPQKAHALAEEFAKRFFAGHQVLLVTHGRTQSQWQYPHAHGAEQCAEGECGVAGLYGKDG